MSAEDRAAVKGGLTDAQFNDLLRVVRETIRIEARAEAEGRRPARLSDAELDYVKRQAAAGVAREEHMNAEAIKWLAVQSQEQTKAQ